MACAGLRLCLDVVAPAPSWLSRNSSASVALLLLLHAQFVFGHHLARAKLARDFLPLCLALLYFLRDIFLDA
jgi:hypothetical protein